MGCEFVDVFSSLLSRNMRNVLTSILALLGDMDLIRYETAQSVFNLGDEGTCSVFFHCVFALSGLAAVTK